MKHFLSLFLALLLFTSTVYAQCTAGSTGSWTTNATWSGCGGGQPAAASNVVIDGDGTVVTFNMTADASISSLRLTDGANDAKARTFRLNGPFTLTISKDLILGQKANFILSGNAKVVVQRNIVSENNGNVSIDGASGNESFRILGCFTLASGSTPNPNIFTNVNWCVESCGQSGAPGNSCDGVLPVSLAQFEAGEENGKVVLEWETAQEKDNAFFTVERSRNGREFEEILRLPGAGNSSLPITYRAEDTAPLSGQSYYRLKQTDIGGTFSYSKIRSVNVVLPDFKLFPNPSENGSFRLLSPSENIISYEIRDLRGLKIYEEKFDFARSEFQSNPTQKLLPALYFVRILQTDGSFKMLRFAVQ